MSYRVRTEARSTSSGLDGTIFVLEESSGAARAEIWPALGFNCYKWQMAGDGRTLDLLYADPQLFGNGRPTRSGIPILFPFPNRIRAGRFTWDGTEFQLPLNDGTGTMAIHGFVCRRPWRVVDSGADRDHAWVTGEFRGSLDAPETQAVWPADYQIRITYRLASGRLRCEAVVTNPDRVGLPFGLGYHPYFRIPLATGGKADDCWVQVPAERYWKLQDCLPTGQQPVVDESRDLNRPRRINELTLDDVLTGLPADDTEEGGLCLRGRLAEQPSGIELKILASPAFREMVLFTPPHREAICLEPYTCTTDAVNLQARGLDAGLLVLPPGESWSAVVEMAVS